MANIAYIRVSSAEQNESRQVEALKPRNIDKWYTEKISDGHNRYSICQKYIDDEDNCIDLYTNEHWFKNRDEAKLWIVNNQRNRRNLTDEQMMYYQGLQYEIEKSIQGGNHGNQYTAKVQDEPLAKIENTAERLANLYNVSASTIKRSEKAAKAIDAIGSVSIAAKQKILAGKAGISKNELIELSSASNNDIRLVASLIEEDNFRNGFKPRPSKPERICEANKTLK